MTMYKDLGSPIQGRMLSYGQASSQVHFEDTVHNRLRLHSDPEGPHSAESGDPWETYS